MDSFRFIFYDASKAFRRPSLTAKDGFRSHVNLCEDL